MLFGFIQDKSPEQIRNQVSCALCLTVVSQSCATVSSVSANAERTKQFTCFRCFAQIIIERRQAKYRMNTPHKRAA